MTIRGLADSAQSAATGWDTLGITVRRKSGGYFHLLILDRLHALD